MNGGAAASIRAAAIIWTAAAAAMSNAAGILDSGEAANGRETAGERIYLEGVLPSGEEIRAARDGAGVQSGGVIACVNCHRRSGLGTVEGASLVPPITVKYLRRSAQINVSDLEMSHLEGYHQSRPAYTDAAIALALRTGMTPDGRSLSPLMPRYSLGDPAMHELIAYLDTLGANPSPGVSDTTLEFATIITPDSDPVEKQAMLSVMKRFFAIQSEVIAAETRPMKSAHEIRYRVTRQWRLHVWELEGDPRGWELQLRDRMRVEPVFAVVSGLGRATWEPVHRFCEEAHVPCLFPNIDVPAAAADDFYSVFFSRSVLLEADLLAEWFAASPRPAASGRLIQLYRAGDAGEAAAAALRRGAAAPALHMVDRLLPAEAREGDLSAALRDVAPGDALVLWLRPPDLRSLPAKVPTAAVALSGLMAGLDTAPLPAGWRGVAHMSYPVDLPEQRMARMNFPFGWFKVQGIPLSAERVQVDTYLACVITAETVGHMFDSFVPEFMLERMEMMIGRRLANAYFPRLGLGQGQRFASKGGYVVHFDGTDAARAQMPPTADIRSAQRARVIADTEWMTP